jgi:membrane protein DedA with SNARE-associated domain
MDLRRFVIYSTAGAFIWSAVLTELGVAFGDRWGDIRKALQPFDLIIAILVVALVALFIWWRLGTPGLNRLRGRGA